MHLPEHAPAGGRRRVEQREIFAPDVGHPAPAEYAEGDRPSALDREIAQARVVIVEAGVAERAVHALAGQFQDSGIELAHDADEPPQLVPGRQAAGDRAPFRSFMAGRARRSEADGAGANRVAQLALHRLHVRLVGLLLERALAHHVGAQRRVTDVAGVIDALGQRLQAIEEFGKGRPLPVDACLHGLGRNVLRPLQVADHEVLVGRRARRQREAAVAHDRRGDAVIARGRPERIPEDLRVHMRVAVDEPGRDDQPLGVDHLARRCAYLAGRNDAAVLNGDIGVVTRQARAVDQRAVLDDEVV